MSIETELREARNKTRAAKVRAAYTSGLRGQALREGAADDERRAHSAGRDRRALNREQPRG